MNSGMKLAYVLTVGGLLCFAGSTASVVLAQDDGPPGGAPGGAPGGGGAGERPDFPPFGEVSKGYTKVNGPPGDTTLLTLYQRDKDQQLLVEFPRDFGRQKHLIAMTISTGETFAGLQGPSVYAYWKRYDKRLALVAPQIQNRSTGDNESKIGVDRVFTDRVLLDVPILSMGPGGGPVIDGDALFAGQVMRFFGGGGFMGSGAAGANPALATFKKCKAFKENIEIAFEMPTNGGLLKTFYYSIRNIPENSGYQPRAADERIGYFQTWYRDLGKFKEDEKWVRYINRWQIEKADPKLKMSPPKEPIVYYVEHTVPIRYRRYIRDGVQYWNKAFEKIGIVDAIEVRIQDKATGQHMDKDPEDSQFNFIRWVNNDISTAIGPSRVNPLTGQILDADVVLTDGWIRAFWTQSNELIPDIVMRGMSDETIAWLEQHPEWDPRVRLAPPPERDAVRERLAGEYAAARQTRGVARYGGVGVPGGMEHQGSIADDLFAWGGRNPAISAANCMAAQGKSVDMAVMRMALEVMDLLEEAPQDEVKPEGKKDDEKKDEKKEKKEPQDLIDGIPEWFVGPSLADLVAHEVGHTLGLRHNFKASTAYSFKDINSEAFRGKRPYTTSVMDYNPVNVCLDKSLVQGDYMQINIGAYDFWAIEYGYGTGDIKKIASRAAEPELQFGSDEDAGGMDASVRRYDLAANPLDYAKARLELAKNARGRILEKFVREGQSWSKARRGYQLTLGMQADAVSIMSNWVGAARVYRDRKGDPNGRPPIDVVPVEQQREALKFVIDTAFNDEAFGLTPDLIKYFTVDRAEDPGVGRSDPEWPVHDQVAGVQASALTSLINPGQMRRVYDNEFRVPADKDTLTVAEVLDTVGKAVFGEIEKPGSGSYTNRQPMISSLRRNLQREFIERLIDLTLPGTMRGEASKPVSNLATAQLRALKSKIEDIAKKGNADMYTSAHLSEAAVRIGKALDAQYIYNTDKIGGSRVTLPFFGQVAPTAGGMTGSTETR
ncbi:MAG: zinc-dependent metalloprotease [Phycisphaerales bacterium]